MTSEEKITCSAFENSSSLRSANAGLLNNSRRLFLENVRQGLGRRSPGGCLDGIVFVKHIVVTSQRLPEPYVLEFVEPILRPTFGKQFVLYEKNQNKDSSRKLIPPPFRPPFRPRFPCPFSVFYSISSPFFDVLLEEIRGIRATTRL